MKRIRLTKKLTILGCTICAIALFIVSASALRSQSSPFYRWGQLEQNHNENKMVLNSESAVAITGEHFEISQDELNFLIEKQRLIDPDTAESVAADILIKSTVCTIKQSKQVL